MITEEVRGDLIDTVGAMIQTLTTVAKRLEEGADVGWFGVSGILSTRMFFDCLNSFLIEDGKRTETNE